jgi:hypothetical protein
MDDAFIPELLRIVRAVEILSPTSFSFAGKIFSTQELALSPWLISPPPNPLVVQLVEQLYSSCYCKRFNGERPADQVAWPPLDDSFLAELSAAHAGKERWDSGWQTHRLLPSGQIIAQKGGSTRLLWPGEFVSHEGPGIAMREGARLSVYAPRDSKEMQPGFYFVFGETISDQQDDYNLLRFYWHVKDTGAPLLVRLVTREFNRFQLPFRFKSLAIRTFYQRSDAAVLYINKRFYRISVELLADIHQEIRNHLDSDTPLFTKHLAPGLGLAEEPGNGESFGQNRCRILAESIWNAYEKHLQTDEERLEEVRHQFERNGLNLDFPFLNSHSTDQYVFPSTRPQPENE